MMRHTPLGPVRTESRVGKPNLDEFLDRLVVLDTPSALIYIGLLSAYDEHGYWLLDVDVHDRGDGHSSKEKYINDTVLLEQEDARQINRRRVFVERTAVVSISALEDIIADRPDDHPRQWEQ